jgi:DNA-binding MarR family transcriptional regulator
MAFDFTPDFAVNVMREIIIALVKRDGPALSAHQLGVFLTCYLHDGDHTVRGLAREMGVSKSVITRALDRLGELGLTSRRIDPLDARSVIVDHTPAGVAMIDGLRLIAANYSIRLNSSALQTH